MAKPFTSKIKIAPAGKPNPEPVKEFDVLIDTGAAFTSLPGLALSQLGIPKRGEMILRLANGQRITRGYGPCEIFVTDRWVGTTVLFADENDIPLLGMNTIDDASLEIDIANKRLISVQAIQA